MNVTGAGDAVLTPRAASARTPWRAAVRRGRAAAVCALLLGAASCGTFFTRIAGAVQAGPGSPVGWFPGMAVAIDAAGFSKITELTWGGGNDESGVYALLFLLSFPVDLVLDTALLPFDLLGALAGWKKVLPS